MKKIYCRLFVLLIALVGVLPAAAWDDAGHKTIAYIAWEQMTPETRAKVFNILMNAPEDSDLSVFYLQDSRSEAVKQREFFMIAATWADIVRDKKFKTRYENYHHSNWHYSDTFWTMENGAVKILPNPEGEGGMATEKLEDFEKVLENETAPDTEKAIAIAWIEHLVGDLHQPLHTSGRVTELEPKGDQGGNLFLLTPKDTPHDKSENLHWFWDSILGRNIPRKDVCDSDYIVPIAETIIKKYPFAEMQKRLEPGKFDKWQQESFKLATTEVFTPDLIRYETPTAKYRRNALRVSEEQMALAGYRLGTLFNQIFGSESLAAIDNKNITAADAKETTKNHIGKGADDAWLWTKTRMALMAAANLKDAVINIEVENSVVTLNGSVKSRYQKQYAVEIVKQIEGIKAVKDLLKISGNKSSK